ncbi:hypothetical protein PTSG_00051 [Salpingoeca rosetta]|uniref:Uncharacterized protein n=1 Tax=Salpingoeca rosetta (strain ATCC 50818 / BSB-021) TaxID=946362 RepID=F2TVD8_SALR5|nr:uncharacterized protein PTSG_00051 [Salpingoeca rosetta]EGD72034.1 hypothetical protein PTSG_00051 [Salpingoeca rosetta]|eukprot:XP_004998606.1 hypothetical protein PTSG_00051 [Salpingoeca rosetta]
MAEETYTCVRQGEQVIATAVANPTAAFKTRMCETGHVIICCLPPFWWALPCISSISCCEASAAKSRARRARLILTNKALYVEGDASAMLPRIPLDELGSVSLSAPDTCLDASNPNHQDFNITMRGKSQPMYSLPCVVDPQPFIDKVFQAKGAFEANERSADAAAQQPQPFSHPQQQPPQPISHQPQPNSHQPQPNSHQPQPMHQAQQYAQHQQFAAAAHRTQIPGALYPPQPSAPMLPGVYNGSAPAASSSQQPPSYDDATNHPGPAANASGKDKSTDGSDPDRKRVFVTLQTNPSQRAIIVLGKDDTWHTFTYAVLQKLGVASTCTPERVRVFLNGFEARTLEDISNDDRLDIVL